MTGLPPELEAKIKAQEDRLESKPDRPRPVIQETPQDDSADKQLTRQDAQILTYAVQGLSLLLEILEEEQRTASVTRRAAYERQLVFFERVAGQVVNIVKKKTAGTGPLESLGRPEPGEPGDKLNVP